MKKVSLLFALLITGTLLITSCSKPQPSAAFSYDKGGGNLPIVVYFTNHSQNAESYYWEFGDGSTSIEKDPVYFYYGNGSYQVTLEARNGSKTDVDVKTVNIP